MSYGCLYLIPTPLNPTDQIDPKTLDLLQGSKLDDLILVEDHKVARQRWLLWGLERERIADFVLYNEHNQSQQIAEILVHLKKGKNAFLLCDEGLPAFCDPGQKLVRSCRKEKVDVKVVSFNQSISLAIALSGFAHQPIYFAGFPPRESEQRNEFWLEIWAKKETLVIMDTPYRLKKICEELKKYSIHTNRYIYIGMNLTLPNEKHYWGAAQKISRIDSKEEFILVIEALN